MNQNASATLTLRRAGPTILGAILLTTILLPSGAVAQQDGPSGNPEIIVRNTDELREFSPAFAKMFCVALRRNHSNPGAPVFREYLDPEYLKKHGLTDREFPIRTAPVVNIFSIHVPDDPHTILCYVDMRTGVREAILLRTVTRAGRLYLSPLSPPETGTRVVTPWILRAELPMNLEAESAEAEALQGVWKPVKAALGGVPLPPPALKPNMLTIEGDQYEVTVEGEPQSDKGTSKLNTSTMPKRMATTSFEGPNKGKTFLAIYEFRDADTLRVCYDLSGSAYPTDFKSPKGTQHYLMTYKHQKD
jgi:uncharacterized protein (TIGR03067 family)